MFKSADLKPGIELQPHQKRLQDLAADHPLRMLLVHGLGSGKGLSSLAAAEAQGKPYTAVVPAALRANYEGERKKFTDEKLPAKVMSYNALAAGKPTGGLGTLIFDEVQRLRSEGSQQNQQAQAAAHKARQLILLSGTPIVNRPNDLAPLISMLTDKPLSQKEFDQQYLKKQTVRPGLWQRLRGVPAGEEDVIDHKEELAALLKGHVDYYKPEKSVVPVNQEEFSSEMTTDQSRLYRGMFEKLPWHTRWKLKHDFPLSPEELRRMSSFMTGPRQIGLSVFPYMRNKDPYKAFQGSPKLQQALAELKKSLADPRQKSLVFSNFIDAGLTPYAAALAKEKIPYGVFHGGLSDVERKQLVDNYNNGKIRAALIGPSGTEGLSFRGTQSIQLLDPHFSAVRPQQAVGRGLRFDSHQNLPPELQNVKIQRFVSRLPLGFKDRLLSMVANRDANTRASDDYLMNMSARKERLNRQFSDLLKEVGNQR